MPLVFQMLLKITGCFELKAARQALQYVHLSSDKVNDFHAIVECESGRLFIEVDSMLVPDMKFDFVEIGFVDRTVEACEHLLFTIPTSIVGIAVVALDLVGGVWLADSSLLGIWWMRCGFMCL